MLEWNAIAEQKQELQTENARLLLELQDNQTTLLKCHEDMSLLRSELGAKDASVSGMTKVPCLIKPFSTLLERSSKVQASVTLTSVPSSLQVLLEQVSQAVAKASEAEQHAHCRTYEQAYAMAREQDFMPPALKSLLERPEDFGSQQDRELVIQVRYFPGPSGRP